MNYKFGNKLRQIRIKKNLTMKEVADNTGVSESLISQIERDKISPSIETLLNIANYLGMDFEYLFEDYKQKRVINIVRKDTRKIITNTNVRYELLSKTKGIKDEYEIEAYYMEIETGSQSGNDEYGHPGKEMGVIIEGRGEFLIGNEKYILNEGDSVSFNSDLPHKLKNIGNSKLKAFWVITPPKSNYL